MYRAFGAAVWGMALAGSVTAGMPATATPAVQQHPPTQGKPSLEAVVDGALAEFLAELLKPGAKQENWSKGGIDLPAIVLAAPGGAQRNFFLSVDTDGERTVSIIDPADPAINLPKSWKEVARTGDSGATPGGGALSIGHLEAEYYLVGMEPRQRVGDAFCSSSDMTGALYEDRAAEAGSELPPDAIQMLFQMAVGRFKNHTVCWRYDRRGDGYKVTYFLPDGRLLPTLNAFDEQIKIVPAADVARLLQGK